MFVVSRKTHRILIEGTNKRRSQKSRGQEEEYGEGCVGGLREQFHLPYRLRWLGQKAESRHYIKRDPLFIHNQARSDDLRLALTGKTDATMKCRVLRYGVEIGPIWKSKCLIDTIDRKPIRHLCMYR